MNEKPLNKVATQRIGNFFIKPINTFLEEDDSDLAIEEEAVLPLIDAYIASIDNGHASGSDTEIDVRSAEATRAFLLGSSATDASRYLEPSVDSQLREAGWYHRNSAKLARACLNLLQADSQSIEGDTDPSIELEERLYRMLDDGMDRGFVTGLNILFGLKDIPEGKEAAGESLLADTRGHIVKLIRSRKKQSQGSYPNLIALCGSHQNALSPKPISKIIEQQAERVMGNPELKYQAAKKAVHGAISGELKRLLYS